MYVRGGGGGGAGGGGASAAGVVAPGCAELPPSAGLASPVDGFEAPGCSGEGWLAEADCPPELELLVAGEVLDVAFSPPEGREQPACARNSAATVRLAIRDAISLCFIALALNSSDGVPALRSLSISLAGSQQEVGTTSRLSHRFSIALRLPAARSSPTIFPLN